MTLLKRLLVRPELITTAVLINEVGEVGFDRLLVQRLDGDAVLLSAGCLDCKMHGDLIWVLDGSATRSGAGQEARRMGETSGLVDPAPVLRASMVHPKLAQSFRLDGEVTGQCGERRFHARRVSRGGALGRCHRSTGADQDRHRRTHCDSDVGGATAGPQPRHAAAAGGLLHAYPYDPTERPEEVRGWPDAEGWTSAHHHDLNWYGARIHNAFCPSFDDPPSLLDSDGWFEMLLTIRRIDLPELTEQRNVESEDCPVVLHAVSDVFYPAIQLAVWRWRRPPFPLGLRQSRPAARGDRGRAVCLLRSDAGCAADEVRFQTT